MTTHHSDALHAWLNGYVEGAVNEAVAAAQVAHAEELAEVQAAHAVEVDGLEATITTQEATIAERDATILELEARIAELEPDPIAVGYYSGNDQAGADAFEALVPAPWTHGASYVVSNTNNLTPRINSQPGLGQIPHVAFATKNYQGGGDTSFMAWRDIAAGVHDDILTQWGDWLANLDHEVWISLESEADQKLNQGKVPSDWTPAEFAGAFARFADVIRSRAPLAKTVFWVAGHQKSLIEGMYPGDAAVDMIGWDPYVNAGWSSTATADTLIREFATWLDGRTWGQGKPRGLCEFGYHNEHPDADGEAFMQGLPAAARKYGLAFLTYFHRNSGEKGNYTLENMPLTAAALSAAARDLIEG